MHAARDARKLALLNCSENDDGNEDLKDFYLGNLNHLMQLPIFSIPSDVLRTISVLLHNTLFFDYDWRSYAVKMGITDNLILAKIGARAKCHHEQEIFITMITELAPKMFGFIITVLLESERYDVLNIIRPDVIKILERHSTTSSIHKQSSEINIDEQDVQPSNTFTESSSEIVSHVNSFSCDNSYNGEKTLASVSVLKKDNNHAFNALQKCSANKDVITMMQDNMLVLKEPSRKESYSQEIDIFPSSSAPKKLSVFIQHTEIDSGIAQELSETLKREGIVVTTLSDMDNLLLMDEMGALSTIFQEVDFIVPIVSETFLQQIHSNVYERYLECTDAMNNKCLYQLILNEYRNNRYVNFRVRPVIVPQMSRRLLINDIIFSFSFRLWAEVPKLIRILKKTKELIPHYSLVNSMKNA